MYLKLNLPTGASKEVLIKMLTHFRFIGIVCAPILMEHYTRLSEKLMREYQIELKVYSRSDYMDEIVECDINENHFNFELFLLDDYPGVWDTLQKDYPKIPALVHMQQFFFSKKIPLIVF
jgi:hypothetical protein